MKRKVKEIFEEIKQEALAQHGIDLEAEIEAALKQEITLEVDREILKNLGADSSALYTQDWVKNYVRNNNLTQVKLWNTYNKCPNDIQVNKKKATNVN